MHPFLSILEIETGTVTVKKCAFKPAPCHDSLDLHLHGFLDLHARQLAAVHVTVSPVSHITRDLIGCNIDLKTHTLANMHVILVVVAPNMKDLCLNILGVQLNWSIK